MNQEQRQAYEWAKNQNHPSVAARYAKILAGLVDEIAPPNEPLTQADLDAMDYDKVWLDYGGDGEWALVVSGRIYALAVLESAGFEDILRDEVDGETMDRPSGDYTVYRRPPERQEAKQ